MKNVYLCSLCRGGVLGGVLYLDDQALRFRTGKITVSKECRNLLLPLKEIHGVRWTWRLFPMACFSMNNGETHRFLIFRKHSFQKAFHQAWERTEGA